MRRVLTAIAIGAGLAATGCGGNAATATDSGTQRAHHAATPSDRTAAGVRALVTEFVHDVRAGRSAEACQLMTSNQRVKLGASTHASCRRALDAVRRALGNADLARDEEQVDSLPIRVSGDTATSPNPEAPGETSRYVYAAGRWRIG